MQNDNVQLEEKEILKDLLLKEEDVLAKLKDLVILSKKYFMIEQNTGKIVFSSDLKIGNKEKIALLLVGRYFASRLGVINKETLTIAELSNILETPKTTLSRPLGTLISEGKVKKDENLGYSAVFHKVEGILKSIE